MILTNKYNLPESFINAIIAHDEEYQAGRGDTDISATQLIKPPLVVQILKQKSDEIVEDVSDRIYSILGSATHKILEDNVETTGTAEQRLFIEVNDWVVSAQGDHLATDGTLTDYKVTGLFKIQKGDFTEYEQQLNILNYIYNQNGYEVKKLQIVAVLRDWSKRKLRFARLRGKNDYPEAPVKVINIPMWTPEKTHQYILERVKLHQQYDGKPLEEVVECTKEEKWQDASKYAVMKEGNANAVRGGVKETLAEAQIKLEELKEAKKGNFYIEERPEAAIRCEDYCHEEFCPYRQVERKEL